MKIKDRAKPPLPPVPGGTYLATCVYSIEIGEQLCKYKDSEKYNYQVLLGFELEGQTVEVDGKQEPRVLSRTFNIARSANAGLRKFISDWLGKKFSNDEFGDLDTCDLVGRPALVSVVLTEDKQYSNITSAIALPAGIPVPQAVSQMIRFDMEPWNQAAFEALPEWARERIKKSTDWAKEHADDSVIQAQFEGSKTAGAADVASMLAQVQGVDFRAWNGGQGSDRPTQGSEHGGEILRCAKDDTEVKSPGPAGHPLLTKGGLGGGTQGGSGDLSPTGGQIARATQKSDGGQIARATQSSGSVDNPAPRGGVPF